MMRITTSDNLQLRHKWLQQVAGRNISPTKSQILGLATMRAFCKMEIPGWFSTITLNTLKHAARHSSTGSDTLDLWLELKSLRVQAFQIHTPKSNPTIIPNLPPLKEQANLALLDAHISTLAYFDLYRFLALMTAQDSNNASEILASIRLKLESSKAKYNSFLLEDKVVSTSNLHVIKGGKDYE